MRARRIRVSAAELLDPNAPAWSQAIPEEIELSPAPLNLALAQSPFMALSTDHGRIRAVAARALHDSRSLALRLAWESETPNEIHDLDQFADAVAVMFPMSKGAEALTMGSTGHPVNAWYYRAGESEPFDVMAEGFGTTTRRRKADGSRLEARAIHEGGRWAVSFLRPLDVGDGYVILASGSVTGIAFAAWEGGNDERAGRKSASLQFAAFELDQ